MPQPILVGILIAATIAIASMICAMWYFQKNTPLVVIPHGAWTREHALDRLCTSKTERCSVPAGQHECCVDHLLSMMRDIAALMGPKVFLLCGTVLAWKRYAGQHIIPHDNDLDMAILASDEKEFVEVVIPVLREKGYVVELQERCGGMTIRNPAISNDMNKSHLRTVHQPPSRWYTVEYSSINSLHVDVALLTEGNLRDGTAVLLDAPSTWYDQVVRMDPVVALTTYRSWVMVRENVLPPLATTFMGESVHVPRDVHAFLCGMYGTSYMTPYNRDNHVAHRGPVTRLLTEVATKPSKVVATVITNAVAKIGDRERMHHLVVQALQEGIQLKKCRVPKWMGDNDTCIMKHRTCWENIANKTSGRDLHLVLADDVGLPHRFVEDLWTVVCADVHRAMDANALPTSVIVRFGNYPVMPTERVMGSLVRNTRFTSGAWAYALTVEAARVLLKKLASMSVGDNVDVAVDRFLYESTSTTTCVLVEVDKTTFPNLLPRYNLKNMGKRYLQQNNTVVQKLTIA